MPGPPPPPPPPPSGSGAGKKAPQTDIIKETFYKGTLNQYEQFARKRSRSDSSASNSSATSTQSTQSSKGTNADHVIQFSEFQIASNRFLGKGMSGVVYTAKVKAKYDGVYKSKSVAVKYANPGRVSELAQESKNFQNEFQILQELHGLGGTGDKDFCPNIVDVYGFYPGKVDDKEFVRPAIIMEKLSGNTLQKVLEEKETMFGSDIHGSQRIKILKGFATALLHVSKKGYHLNDDSHSDNFMVTTDNVAKVIDVGKIKKAAGQNSHVLWNVMNLFSQAEKLRLNGMGFKTSFSANAKVEQVASEILGIPDKL
jgi:hypothetical protein